MNKIITVVVFIYISLVVGFITSSLSFTQTAFAQVDNPPVITTPPRPQCPEGTISFERGMCELEPTCEPLGEGFVLIDGECVKRETHVPTCSIGEFDPELGKCITNKKGVVPQCDTIANPPYTLEGNECARYIIKDPVCLVGELNGEICQIRPGVGNEERAA
jgi:hypothetical protein